MRDLSASPGALSSHGLAADAAPGDAPHVFQARPGQTEWWVGDGTQFPLLEPATQHPHLITRVNVLNEAQCKLLISCFVRNRKQFAAHTGSKYWDGRYIWQNRLTAKETDAIRVMQQARFLTQAALTQFFLPTKPLYSDTAQLVRWDAGIELTPHVDNLEPDGRPNTTAHRAFSSIIYLNDDYEGGETFFPGLRVRLRPRAGALVAFGAGAAYVHGVTKVKKGVRYTYAGWFTHDKDREDANAMCVF